MGDGRSGGGKGGWKSIAVVVQTQISIKVDANPFAAIYYYEKKKRDEELRKRQRI